MDRNDIEEMAKDLIPLAEETNAGKAYTYWRGGYTNRDRFITKCHRYIDDSTAIINNRARHMIETLEQKLNCV